VAAHPLPPLHPTSSLADTRQLLHPLPRTAAVMSSAVRPPHPNPSLLPPALSILCACAHVCHKRCTIPQSLSEFSPMPSPTVVPGSVRGCTPPSLEVSAAGGGGEQGGLTVKSPVPQTTFRCSGGCRKVGSFSLGGFSFYVGVRFLRAQQPVELVGKMQEVTPRVTLSAAGGKGPQPRRRCADWWWKVQHPS